MIGRIAGLRHAHVILIIVLQPTSLNGSERQQCYTYVRLVRPAAGGAWQTRVVDKLLVEDEVQVPSQGRIWLGGLAEWSVLRTSLCRSSISRFHTTPITLVRPHIAQVQDAHSLAEPGRGGFDSAMRAILVMRELALACGVVHGLVQCKPAHVGLRFTMYSNACNLTTRCLLR
jgi:hypothetical protein